MSAIAAGLGAIALLALPIICGYALYKGFSTGRMPARGASYSREESPVWFWLLAAMYAGLPMFEFSIVGRVAWDIFSGR